MPLHIWRGPFRIRRVAPGAWVIVNRFDAVERQGYVSAQAARTVCDLMNRAQADCDVADLSNADSPHTA